MSLSPEQLAEIEQLREQRSSTLRAVSEGMEGIFTRPILFWITDLCV